MRMVMSVDYGIDSDGELVRSINSGSEYDVLVDGKWVSIKPSYDAHDDWLHRTTKIPAEKALALAAERGADPDEHVVARPRPAAAEQPQ